MRYRVAIVGAGPAGSTAALRLAQRGIDRVLLLDKDKFPRDKTCGSALSPNALRVAAELGIGDEVWRLGYRIHGLRLKTPGNREMRLVSGEVAVVLLRKEFDALLVERARECEVEFRDGFRVTELRRQSGRVVGVRGNSGDVEADFVLCADGAHSVFSHDPRPKRTISTVMGWWENFDFEVGMMEMIFDKKLALLYGWMFPETAARVNIGICMDGGPPGKRPRNIREVFNSFLADHFTERLAAARPVGRWQGHPISHTIWLRDFAAPGVLYIGESARITNNLTGEGIYHAMQSGIHAADALADHLLCGKAEVGVRKSYERRCRREFTLGFALASAGRLVMRTPLLEIIALMYNHGWLGRSASWGIGSALAGSSIASQENRRTF